MSEAAVLLKRRRLVSARFSVSVRLKQGQAILSVGASFVGAPCTSRNETD